MSTTMYKSEAILAVILVAHQDPPAQQALHHVQVISCRGSPQQLCALNTLIIEVYAAAGIHAGTAPVHWVLNHI